ncbi:hypothetical protein M8007_14330 [Dinoroseobacter shibae]|uniref:hypothetical protein n=2 Tax=Dinoroseobacter shibae TaxID=215813 RepID=UPI00030F9D2A|nr:hypothetical protein [Dinoroseobacter shibae]URF45941.1 hypothetical protein M8008_14330 [Dinoroseobacter shibae]URF50247.1 hypothetical protein M8007_14330 [Dinoroseobacter shibae]
MIAMARIARSEAVSTLMAVPFYAALGPRAVRGLSVPPGLTKIGVPAVQMRRDP